MSEPALQYAVFCRDMLIEPGEISILGIMDAVVGNIASNSVEPPFDELSLSVRHSLVLALGLVGVERGKHRIWIAVQTPSGKLEKPSSPQEFEVRRDSGITHMKANINLDIIENGVYRLYILLVGEPLKEIGLPVSISIVSP